MNLDLSYYWEGAREWCDDKKLDEEKKNAAKVYFYPYLVNNIYKHIFSYRGEGEPIEIECGREQMRRIGPSETKP